MTASKPPALSPTPEGLVLYSADFRVKLALPTAQDDEPIAALRSDPSVRKHMPFLPVLTKEDVALQREQRAQDPSILDVAVFVRDDDNLPEDDEVGEINYQFAGVSGVFGMSEEHLACEAGIIIAPAFQGKGLTTPIFYTLFKYLFENKGIHRVLFETSAANGAMIGWLEKVARARLEGERRQAWRSADEGWVDVKSFAILEVEWKGRVKAALEKKMGVKPITW
ncbi:hypothetical protein H1R20_g9017, partial [Candolleomyces eurysporus]